MWEGGKLAIFHSQSTENTQNKYVLKGLPLLTEPTTIQDALQEKGIDIKQIRQMTKTYTDENNTHSMRKIPVWVLTVNYTDETRQKIKDLQGLLYFKIPIEELRNKRTVTQCLRCQGFGHKAQYCKLTRKCRLCRTTRHKGMPKPTASTEVCRMWRGTPGLFQRMP